jgi:hypothetical protein
VRGDRQGRGPLGLLRAHCVGGYGVSPSGVAEHFNISRASGNRFLQPPQPCLVLAQVGIHDGCGSRPSNRMESALRERRKVGSGFVGQAQPGADARAEQVSLGRSAGRHAQQRFKVRQASRS